MTLLKPKQAGTLIYFLLAFMAQAKAIDIIRFTPTKGDMTWKVRTVIENAKSKEIKLIFEKGKYTFRPDYATDKYCYITNHENGLKKIAFLFEEFKSVEIEGNDAELIFHGRILPFVFEKCEKVDVKGITIDWDIPFTFQGEVVAVNKEEGWRDIKPHTEGFSWKVKGGKLIFPNIDGFSYSKMASTLAFYPENKQVAHGAFDIWSLPEKVEKRKNGILRFHEKMKQYPEVGTILHSKGSKDENRYGPAFHAIASKNVRFDDITIHSALGMGFLAEKSENVRISNSAICVREGSQRVVSIIADATHFCNCKGEIIVENCRFEHMLDDGTNVHGTYAEIDQVLDEHTVRYKLVHSQQLGFVFAETGDEMWFIQQPNPQRGQTGKVVSVKVVNDHFADVTFKSKLPKGIKKGDILENKTWNPTFVMRGCTIQNHRARNIVIKTPETILIENNFLSSMMSSIFFRGEAYYWFESGAVNDVTIRNNHFGYCAYSGAQHAIMYITPRFNKRYAKDFYFDRNIKFIDNKIETFDNRIVWADRVDGLVITGNKIKQVKGKKQLYPNAYLFDFKNCKSVVLMENNYEGDCKKSILVDDKTASSIKIKANKGFVEQVKAK